ncbi:MAG TPA: hypothetical protein DD856_13500 [Sulfobacillus sp.]|nr:hypothetical protein [Sulfobacillus sp.]
MVGHYVRVQDAANLLGVSPVTIRWYSQQGWLPSYRVGRGRVHHRRFKYADVQALAQRTGRFIPEEPEWDKSRNVSTEMAAQYLGLSSRYLLEAGWLKTGENLSWQELKDVENRIYPDPENSLANGHEEGGLTMLDNREGHPGGCGWHGVFGSRGRGPGRPKWESADIPGHEASLLALRRAKRHLEARKADLEDQIQELEKRIAKHPDNNR